MAIEIGQWTEKRQVTLGGDLGARLIAARKRKMERESALAEAAGGGKARE